MGKKRNKKIASYNFGRSDLKPEDEEIRRIQILVASFFIFEEMPDDHKKIQFKSELINAMKKTGDADYIIRNYQPFTAGSEETLQLYSNASDIANNKWQDPRPFNRYFGSLILALAQLVGSGVAVADNLLKRSHNILAAIFAPTNALANFYFTYSSLPDINSRIAEDIGQFYRNRNHLERKQILKSFTKQLFGIICAFSAAMIEASFIFGARERFGNDKIRDAILAMSFVAMSLVYKDALDDMINKIPGSKQELKELRQDLRLYYLELRTLVSARQTPREMSKSLLKATASIGAVTMISARVGALGYGTYKNYEKEFGQSGAITAAVLASIPLACLTILSAIDVKKFFTDHFFRSSQYVRQHDAENPQLPARQDNKKNHSLTDIGSTIIATGIFLSGSMGSASLVESQGIFAVFCIFCVTATVFARNYLAKIKTPEELDKQEKFIKFLESNLTPEWQAKLQEFTGDSPTTSAKPGVKIRLRHDKSDKARDRDIKITGLGASL